MEHKSSRFHWCNYWGAGAPPGDNYLHRKLIRQRGYIYILKCTFIMAKDAATASLRVRYLARATPWQRRASAPPVVPMRTWCPTSAPRHRAATPERVGHKHKHSQSKPMWRQQQEMDGNDARAPKGTQSNCILLGKYTDLYSVNNQSTLFRSIGMACPLLAFVEYNTSYSSKCYAPLPSAPSPLERNKLNLTVHFPIKCQNQLGLIQLK